jgi:hypothetical protein
LLLLARFVIAMTGSTANWSRLVGVALSGATLVAALFAADATPRFRRLGATVAVSGFAITIAVVAAGQNAEGVAAVLDAALVIVAPIAIGRAAVRRHVVDLQTVLAALCIYVLLGMLWAFLYDAIGSFATSPFFAQPVTATSADYLYFSFITELTVGYGDLTAAGNLGRSFAVLEGLIGQLYLVTVVAVVVSRLAPRHPAGGSPTSE